MVMMKTVHLGQKDGDIEDFIVKYMQDNPYSNVSNLIKRAIRFYMDNIGHEKKREYIANEVLKDRELLNKLIDAAADKIVSGDIKIGKLVMGSTDEKIERSNLLDYPNNPSDIKSHVQEIVGVQEEEKKLNTVTKNEELKKKRDEYLQKEVNNSKSSIPPAAAVNFLKNNQ